MAKPERSRPPPPVTAAGILTMILWTALVTTASAQAPETAPATGGGYGVLWTLAITNIVGIVMVVLKNMHDAKVKRDDTAAAVAAEQRRIAADIEKETRHRQWQIEDRDRLAREVAATGKVLAARVEQASTDLAKTAAASHHVVLGAIKENTQVNADALNRANHLTEKIARYTGMFKEDQAVANSRLTALEDSPVQTSAAAVDVLERIDETTQKTLEVVTEKQP